MRSFSWLCDSDGNNHRRSNRPSKMTRIHSLSDIALMAILTAWLRAAVQAERIDVTCKADPATDAKFLNGAIARSNVGDIINAHGTCILRETVVLEAGRRYTGDSRTGTVLIQANGSNLEWMVASRGVVQNNTWTDDPLEISGLTIDGNAGGNVEANSVCLALKAWFTTAHDIKVQQCGGDGILLSSATPSFSDGPNGRISNSWISEVGGHGVHIDGETTDWNLVDNWISDTGKSAIYLHSAAGWQINGNHLYGISEHAIMAEACWATTITNNYIEDFGRIGTAAPRVDNSSDAGQSVYYGIGCFPGGGAASVIANNKIFHFGGQDRLFKNASFVFIGVDRVRYGAGQVNVVGNVVAVENGTASHTGLSYAVGHGEAGRALRLISSNNNVQVGPVGTARALDPTVTLVPSL